MDRNPRFASHRIDGATFYLDLDANELEVMLSHEHANAEYPRRPLLRLTVADAMALQAFLSMPDVAAVLLNAGQELQAERKRVHDDPANH